MKHVVVPHPKHPPHTWGRKQSIFFIPIIYHYMMMIGNPHLQKLDIHYWGCGYLDPLPSQHGPERFEVTAACGLNWNTCHSHYQYQRRQTPQFFPH